MLSSASAGKIDSPDCGLRFRFVFVGLQLYATQQQEGVISKRVRRPLLQ